MRIDYSFPKTSVNFLYMDVPYRYAYRHLHVATDRLNGVLLPERVVHVAFAVIFAVPVLGVIVALVSRILFPKKEEVVAHPAREKFVERSRSRLDRKSLMDLMEGEITVSSLTPERIGEYANLGKFWTFLEANKSEVAAEFTLEDFSELVNHADLALLPERCKTLTGIIELFSGHQPSGLEEKRRENNRRMEELEQKLQLFCSVATPEMELVLRNKLNQLKRWFKEQEKNEQAITTLIHLMNESIDEAKKKRAEAESVNPMSEKRRSSRVFKYEVREIVHGKPVNSGEVTGQEALMSDSVFFEGLDDPDKLRRLDFLVKLLSEYRGGDAGMRSRLVNFMRQGLSEQSVANAIFENTVNLYPEQVAVLVQVLNAVEPAQINNLWSQLVKNQAAFVGKEGQKANRERLKVVFSSLSMQQLKASLDDHKFETLIEENGSILTECFSADQLELVGVKSSHEVSLQMISPLESSDLGFEAKLRVMCNIFPKVLAYLQEDLGEWERSRILTVERILRANIQKLEEPEKREALTEMLSFR